MKTYYNEFDKKKCAVLKQLMSDGHISKGDIDDRSIRDVQPTDLKGYDRCHFFAGIGLWDYALQLAGWPDDRQVWTGSCPCQPFSTAGRQKAKADDRHLWPEWERLIGECRPATVFGEQVAAAITYGWLDDVYQGMESKGYAVGAVVLPACSVGAPHRRDRLWFVANSESELRGSDSSRRREVYQEKRNDIWYGSTNSGTLGNSEQNGLFAKTDTGKITRDARKSKEGSQFPEQFEGASTSGDVSSNVAYTDCERPQGQWGYEQQYGEERRETEKRHHWESGFWIDCPDGKQRLIEPGIPLLANGDTERVGIIHAAGDAIVPQVAAEFIKAFKESVYMSFLLS